MAAHLITATEGNNADGAIRNIPQQSGKWLFEMKHDRVIVGSIDAIHEPVRGRLGAANLALQQGIEGPLDIAGGERAPIMEFHILMQVEYIGARIGNFPALR